MDVPKGVNRVTVPGVSKDNVVFGVEAFDALGHSSPRSSPPRGRPSERHAGSRRSPRDAGGLVRELFAGCRRPSAPPPDAGGPDMRSCSGAARAPATTGSRSGATASPWRPSPRADRCARRSASSSSTASGSSAPASASGAGRAPRRSGRSAPGPLAGRIRRDPAGGAGRQALGVPRGRRVPRPAARGRPAAGARGPLHPPGEGGAARARVGARGADEDECHPRLGARPALALGLLHRGGGHLAQLAAHPDPESCATTSSTTSSCT
jgi:hypothetical protein